MKLKKLLALILALAMVLTSMPLALAEEGAAEVPAEQPAPVEAPAEEPAAEPVAEPAPEPEPVPEPVPAEEPAPEPVAEPASEPVEEFEEAAPVEAANEQITEETEIVVPVDPANEVVVPKYKITFESDGGTPVTTIADISEGSTVNKPADPTKYGYDFAGWLGDFVFIEDATTEIPATPIDHDYELFADWDAKEVDVSWSLGTPGGSYAATPEWKGNAPEATTVDFAEDIPAAEAAAVCEGYNFVGWKYVGNDDEDDDTIGSEGPIVVTAQWEIKTVDVTFAAGQGAPEGTVIPEDMEDIDYGTVVAVPDDLESKDGKTFTGWKLNGEPYVAGPVKEDIELVGSWSQDEVTVTFWKDKGDETPYATKTTAWGGNVELPGDPVDEGRTFSTWVLADGTAFVATGIEADVDVYATWNTQTREVSFDLNGGEGEEGQFAPQNVPYNTTAADPGKPTKFGYHLTGWKNGEDDFSFDTKITEDTVLTAQWEGNAYALEIDTSAIAEDVYIVSDGDPKKLENPVYKIEEYGEYHGFTVPQITAKGHEFDGYKYTYQYTKEDGTVGTKETAAGVLDLAEEMVFTTTGENEYTLVLTPVRTKDFWDVQYVAEGYEVPEAEQIVYGPEGNPDISETMQAQKGKADEGTFVLDDTKYLEGWYNGETKWNFDDEVTGHMDLTANLLDVWTVTFDCNGGDPIAPVLIPDGMSFNEFVEAGLPIPELEKNTFMKWLYKGKDYDGTAKITADITLVAQWVPTYYEVKIDPDNGDDPVTGSVLDSESIIDTEDIVIPRLESDDKDGCIFVGWFLEDEDGEIDIDGDEYDFGTPVTKPITVRAGWIEAAVAKVEDEGRILFETLDKAVSSVVVDEGDTLTLLKDVKDEEVREINRQFVIDLNSKTLSVDLATSTTLILKGGTVNGSEFSTTGEGKIEIENGTYLNIEFAEGVNLSINEDGGAKFDDAAKEYIEANNADMEAYDDIHYMFKQTATSSGYWTLVPYVTLTIDTNKEPVEEQILVKVGQDDPTDYEYNFGTDEEPSDIPLWDGHDFVKWTLDGEDFEWGTAVEEDTTITANWQLFHTVTFDWDDADNEPEEVTAKVNDGDTVEKPDTDPEKEGKIFEFWGYEVDERLVEYDFSSEIHDDLTLIAKWEWVVTFDPDNGDDPIEVTVKNGAQVDSSQVPNPTRDDGSTFLGWYYENNGHPDGEYKFRDEVWGDYSIIAAWNNTAWQIESYYGELAGVAEKTPTTLTYSGTEEEPIYILPAGAFFDAFELDPEKYYLGYRFEAPSGITVDNANLYSMWYDGEWVVLTDAMDADSTSMSGHILVSVFEEISIDSIKQWADAGEPVVFTYKFARTADKDDESKVETLTVTFDPNYLFFIGNDMAPVFNVTDYRYIYTVEFDHNDGETGIVPEETMEIESGNTIDHEEVVNPEYEGKAFIVWTKADPTSEEWPNYDFTNIYRWDWEDHTFSYDEGAYREIMINAIRDGMNWRDPIFEDTLLHAYWVDLAKVTLIVDGEEILPFEPDQEFPFPFGLGNFQIGTNYNTVEGYVQSAEVRGLEYRRLKCQDDEDERIFWRWVDADGNEFTSNSIYNGDWTLQEELVLYAVFSPSTVTFNLNDSEDAPAEWLEELEIAVPTDQRIGDEDLGYEEYTETNPEREGYEFMYWTLQEPDADGNYSMEDDELPEKFDLMNDKVTDNMTLHAFWIENLYDFQTTLSMEDTTGINVLINLPEGEVPADYTVIATPEKSMYAEDATEVCLADCSTKTIEDAVYYRVMGVMHAASTEMTDEVTVTLLKNGEEVKTAVYTVNGIVQERLASGELDAKREKLNRALVQYGRYAQIRFDNKTDDMPDADPDAPALTAIPDEYAAGDDPTTMADYISLFEGKIEMADSVSMNIYLTPAEGYTLDDYVIKVTKNGAAYTNFTAPTMRGSKIFIKIQGILSYEMDNDFSIEVTLRSDATKSATWTRSLITCAYENYQAAGDNQARKDLMMSLYQYFLASVDRFLN